ncbi:hypothetical protein PPERSA_10541 [Pseudocohnilembus persalinus]|uniref:Uncharacterized protein n=1 Tax=Pseudocohnilembus persalinus TaxID=266149 RepID=A0A0V0QMI2_PSEPJ|nr:hypothetical protein PPERSA_10541 [Pseudocohnilembus persalinus]|eukprot:KRX03168.1 hypothetical protein PPERSA_10541 [Pseudocohnilembus persalinus]
MALSRQSLQRPKIEPIVFTDDDSICTDNSFNSSVDGENNDEYKNSFWHLKEQIQQFFQQNPALQDSIKFEPFKMDFDDEEEQKQDIKISPQYEQSNTKPQDQQKLWGSITKDVIRNGQFSSQIPTLETVNHRLNIFKKKLERIDYLEILQKENLKEKPKDKNKDKEMEKNKSPEQNQKQVFIDGDTEYYSYKKTQQLKLQKQREKAQDQQNKLKFQGRKNITVRGNSAAAELQQRPIFQTQDGQVIIGKVAGRNKNRRKSEDKEQKKEEQKEQQTILDTDLEFQTPIGKFLYQSLKQSGNDIERFRSQALSLLEDYNAKKQDYKQKRFPPTINKFTTDETKSLNLLLPDFQNPLFQPGKNNLFEEIENYTLPKGTPESQFIGTIDKILNGKVIKLWKESQNNN